MGLRMLQLFSSCRGKWIQNWWRTKPNLKSTNALSHIIQVNQNWITKWIVRWRHLQSRLYMWNQGDEEFLVNQWFCSRIKSSLYGLVLLMLNPFVAWNPCVTATSSKSTQEANSCGMLNVKKPEIPLMDLNDFGWNHEDLHVNSTRICNIMFSIRVEQVSESYILFQPYEILYFYPTQRYT